MTFWDGTKWVPDAEMRAPATPTQRTRPSGRLAILLVVGLMLVLPLQGVFASSRTGATLGVVFSTAPVAGSVAYGTPYTVTGCGYDAANGGVTVVVNSPEAISFAGQIPDASGCVAVANFSTQGSGAYTWTSYQTIHHKDQVMAKTSLTLQ